MRSFTRLASASLLPLLLASTPAFAAPGGDFHDGDFYVVSSSIGGTPFFNTCGVLRIDAASGATTPILIPTGISRFATFDSFRRKLVVGLQPTTSSSTYGVYFLDADGSYVQTPLSPSAAFGSAVGDGRIFYFENNGTANRTVKYLDAANAVHPVMDVTGAAPLTFTVSGASESDFLYEPTTHSLWVSTNQPSAPCGYLGSVVASVIRIPLNAAGTQATGASQQFPICVPVQNNGMYFPSNITLGPNGTVMMILARNGAPDPFPTAVTIDPATMAPTVWATLAYPGVTTSGCYSHAYNAVMVLDTFTDTVRAFAPGVNGGGMVLTNSLVSSAGGSSEVAKILEVSGGSTGLANYGTGTAGCSGAEVLTTNQTPKVNAADFRFLSTNAPASSLGLLIIADAADAAGTDVFNLGILLHVNLFTATQVYGFDMNSNAIGLGTSAPIPLLPGLAGLTLYGQGLWFWSTCTPPSGTGLSTTNGLAFTVQP